MHSCIYYSCWIRDLQKFNCLLAHSIQHSIWNIVSVYQILNITLFLCLYVWLYENALFGGYLFDILDHRFFQDFRLAWLILVLETLDSVDWEVNRVLRTGDWIERYLNWDCWGFVLYRKSWSFICYQVGCYWGFVISLSDRDEEEQGRKN